MIKEVLEKYKERIPVRVLAELLTDIDEAEAKQKEPCIWKWRIIDKRKVFRNCLYREDTHIAYAFKYCPYCGKVRKEEPEVCL